MELPTYFDDFLPIISPTQRQRDVMKREHAKLRELLMADPTLKLHLLATFIQGSHRRATAIRGGEAHPCDVDIVAVTNLPRSRHTAAAAHELFRPFLTRHYPNRFEPQDRSWCITVDPEVKLDLVPTSEPDSAELREAVVAKGLSGWSPEAPAGLAGLKSLNESLLEEARRDQEWEKSQPLWIPDRTLHSWEQTHPLFLIGWTARKNLECNGHFGHVVKVIKWWRRHMEPLPKYPKGYPLEHLIGDCCPSGITSVAQGVVRTFEEISRRYASEATAKRTPFLASRGVTNPEVNVMKRVTGEDFAGFHACVNRAVSTARLALDTKDVAESAKLWGKLLGSEFPEPPPSKGNSDSVRVAGGFAEPSRPSKPEGGRFG